MIVKEKPRLLRAGPLGHGPYAFEVAIGSVHVYGTGDTSGPALCDLIASTLSCAEMIAKANAGTIQVASSEQAKKLLRGIVQAALNSPVSVTS